MSIPTLVRELVPPGVVLIVLLLAPGASQAEGIPEKPREVPLPALRESAAANVQAVATLPAVTEKARLDAAATRRDLGVAGSRNFTVLAPRGNHLAELVLQQAELFRREAALEWLGGELPDGAEFTHISVRISDTSDEGLTLLCGPGRRLPGDHRMWITSPLELATGCTLAHEVTHVVLNARFPDGMPAWANEGIASRRDDEKAHEIRRKLLASMVETKAWPNLGVMLATKAIKPSDQRSYAVSTALVEFFLARSEPQTLIAFVDAGLSNGWDAALETHYGINGAAQLQTQWQEWVQATYGTR